MNTWPAFSAESQPPHTAETESGYSGKQLQFAHTAAGFGLHTILIIATGL